RYGERMQPGGLFAVQAFVALIQGGLSADARPDDGCGRQSAMPVEPRIGNRLAGRDHRKLGKAIHQRQHLRLEVDGWIEIGDLSRNFRGQLLRRDQHYWPYCRIAGYDRRPEVADALTGRRNDPEPGY